MRKKFIPLLLICLLFVTGFVFTGCSKSKNSYEVVAYTWNSRYGLVDMLDSTFVEGTEVTVKATPIKSANASTVSEFVCWIHDNKVVSADAEYTFEVNFETSGAYYAVFTCPEIEFVAIDNFTFANELVAEGEFSIKSLTLQIGNSQESYQTVFTATEEDLSSQSIAKTFEDLYLEDSFPYVFNKLEKIYIKLDVTYIVSENQYVSSTEKTISAVNLGQEIEELTFNLEKAKMNNSEIELVDSDANTFTINFTSLENFEFETTTDEENNEEEAE